MRKAVRFDSRSVKRWLNYTQMTISLRRLTFGLLSAFSLGLAGCASVFRPSPGSVLKRSGDEIVVAGQLFHTGTPVITWMDPHGFDGYRVERRFSPLAESSWEKTQRATKEITTPNRYSIRGAVLSPEEIERFRGGAWDLATLQRVVDEFVIHYDECGTSKVCFDVLHDRRGLSVHFLLDIDGTIYQTLDLKERARHATSANDRSIGIEIANMGAFAPQTQSPLADWYARDASGKTYIKLPKAVDVTWIHTPGFVGYPLRSEPIVGVIQGQLLKQYDYTSQQYQALIRLTAALCKIFPNLKCDYPHDSQGNLITHKLTNTELKSYRGILGHYHVQMNKIDPGPAFNWPNFIKAVSAEIAD